MKKHWCVKWAQFVIIREPTEHIHKPASEGQPHALLLVSSWGPGCFLKSLVRNEHQPIEEESQLPLLALISLQKDRLTRYRMSPRHRSSVSWKELAMFLRLAAASGYLLIHISAKSWQGQITGMLGSGKGTCKREKSRAILRRRARPVLSRAPKSYRAPLIWGELLAWSSRRSTLCRLPWATRNSSQNKTLIWRIGGG